MNDLEFLLTVLVIWVLLSFPLAMLVTFLIQDDNQDETKRNGTDRDTTA